jgi:hypothetical protein
MAPRRAQSYTEEYKLSFFLREIIAPRKLHLASKLYFREGAVTYAFTVKLFAAARRVVFLFFNPRFGNSQIFTDIKPINMKNFK